MANSSSIKYAAKAALLLLWLAMVEASIYRTTVQTTETVIDHNGMAETGAGWPGPTGCQSERMDLDECRRYVEHGRRDMFMLASGSGGSSERAPTRCCQKLRQMREECRCEAIRQLVSGERWSKNVVDGGDEERRMKRAENLPRTCGLSNQRCSIHVGIHTSV